MAAHAGMSQAERAAYECPDRASVGDHPDPLTRMVRGDLRYERRHSIGQFRPAFSCVSPRDIFEILEQAPGVVIAGDIGKENTVPLSHVDFTEFSGGTNVDAGENRRGFAGPTQV